MTANKRTVPSSAVAEVTVCVVIPEVWASRGRLQLDQLPGDGMWGNDPFQQQQSGLRAA